MAFGGDHYGDPSALARRVLVVTGKGGVGKTTIAAATAVRSAMLGQRTLVVSTDAAHSLADSFESAIGPEPTPLGDDLWGQQLDGRRQAEQSWTAIRDYLAELLDWAGADELTADELLVVPGMQEAFALDNILAQADSGRFDRIVVDCAPSAETLRLLELPEVLAWYLDRVFPSHRRFATLTRPFLRRASDMPFAGDEVLKAFVDFIDRLGHVRSLLIDPDVTSIRLVTAAEQLAVAESRRLFAHLNLFGYTVDSIVVNRLLADAERGTALLDKWHLRQAKHVGSLEEAFGGVGVLRSELAAEEPLGLDRLEELGARLYGESDPWAARPVRPALRFERHEGTIELRVDLPGFTGADVDVHRRDDELLVTAGSERRGLTLPESPVPPRPCGRPLRTVRNSGSASRRWAHDGAATSQSVGRASATPRRRNG